MPAAAGGRAFTVMVKPVGAHCNLRCSYCYYLPTPQQGAPRMSDEVLERFIADYISASPGPEVGFVWHGGEPTLAGLDFYRRAVELQRRYLPDGWTCWNSLQTNGVLLDDRWCAFLAEEGFDVGLSIDGVDWIHDLYRRDDHGAGSYRAAADAITRLRDHGVRPDLLCTVTSATAAEPMAVYRRLRDFGTGWIQFIPIVRRDAAGRATPDSVEPLAYGDFLCAVFDDWLWHDLGRVDVQLFAETTRMLAGGQAGVCWLAPTCGRALVVETDGGVFSCDHFVDRAHRLGALTNVPLGDLANSAVQDDFGQAKQTTLSERCRACDWLGLCQGGCPKDRWGGAPGLNYLCAGLERYFAHATPELEQVIAQTRRGASPAAIMADRRQAAEARWRGVGRNDPCPCGSGRKAKQCCWSTARPR